MALTESVVELASYADVAGLPWDQINATGGGVLGSGEYVYQLNQTWDRFYALLTTLAISNDEWEGMSPGDARKAWNDLSDELGRRSDDVFAAVSNAELSLAWEQAVELKTDYVRGLVVNAAAVANAGMLSHEGGLTRFAVETGQTTLTQAEADADNLNRMMECVLQMDDFGVLSEIKRPGMSGVGAAPLVGGYLALVVIAAIFAVAGVVVYVWSVSETNAERREWCLDDAGNLRPNAPDFCQRPPENPLADALAGGAREFGKALGTGIAVVAGIAILIWAVKRSAVKRGARLVTT
jgi:hypothetical protein